MRKMKEIAAEKDFFLSVREVLQSGDKLYENVDFSSSAQDIDFHENVIQRSRCPQIKATVIFVILLHLFRFYLEVRMWLPIDLEF